MSQYLFKEMRETLESGDSIVVDLLDLPQYDNLQVSIRCTQNLLFDVQWFCEIEQDEHDEYIETFNIDNSLTVLSLPPRQQFCRMYLKNESGFTDNWVSLAVKSNNYLSSLGLPMNQPVSDLSSLASLTKSVLVDPETGENYDSANPIPVSATIDTAGLATEVTVSAMNDKLPSLGAKPSAGSVSVVNTSSGFTVQTRADEEENTAKSNTHLLAIGGYHDNTRTVANQRYGAVAINNNGQLEVEVVNSPSSSLVLATEGKQDDAITQLTNLNTKLDGLVKTNDLLRVKRSEDKSYAVTINGGVTASTDPDLIIWNPVGSGVTVYLYHLSYQYAGTVSSDGLQKIEVELINAFTATGGLAIGPVEMNYNTTSNSNQAVVYYSGNTSTRWRNLHDEYFYCTTTGNNFHRDLKLENDILAIGEGLGIRIQQDNPDAGMRFNIHARWYEE
jgi:hypothetical protein